MKWTDETTYGRAMTCTEFNELVNLIRKEHSFGKGGKMVKYIEPTLDMRTDDVFHVTFRGFFAEKTFDFRDNERSMLDNIHKWLKEPA